MKHCKESISHEDDPFIPLMLVGRFKKVTGEKLFYQPLAAMMNGDRRLDKWFAGLFKQQWEGNVNHRNGCPFPWTIEGGSATQSICDPL